jgi:hypothetical protein
LTLKRNTRWHTWRVAQLNSRLSVYSPRAPSAQPLAHEAPRANFDSIRRNHQNKAAPEVLVKTSGAAAFNMQTRSARRSTPPSGGDDFEC